MASEASAFTVLGFALFPLCLCVTVTTGLSETTQGKKEAGGGGGVIVSVPSQQQRHGVSNLLRVGSHGRTLNNIADQIMKRTRCWV